MKKLIVILITLVLTGGFGAISAQDFDPAPLVNFVAHSQEFVDWLAQYPNYQNNAWEADSDANIWHIEFYNEDWSEWLGYALIDADSGEITESFVPRPLPPDVHQRQLARIEPLLLQDPEVIALIQDPILWDYSIDYNRWDQVWEAWFSRGVRAWVFTISYNEEEGYLALESIEDAYALEEEDAFAANRDTAIQLAYEAGGAWEALSGYDDWTTYSEPQQGSQWSVTFVSGETELFFALVDVETRQVIEAVAP